MASAGKARHGLRWRMVFAIVVIVSLVVLIMSTYFTIREAEQVGEATRAKIEVMRESMREKGLLLAQNVALSSERAIAERNYLFVKDVVDNVQQHNKNIAYGIIMSQARMALVHTDVAKAGNVLGSPHDLQAAQADTPTTLEVNVDGKDYLEVVSPIQVAGRMWGKVRFGLSLESLNNEIQRSDELSRQRIFITVLTSVLGALVLMAVGSWLGLHFSKQLTGPLDSLLEAVRFFQHGDLDRRVNIVRDIPEFDTLASAFNDMGEAVKRRQIELEVALRRMEEAYRLKSEFLANVSHELRTPLNAIINVPNILMKDYASVTVFTCGTCGARYTPDEEDGDAGAIPESVECPACNGQARAGSSVLFSGNPSDHLGYLEMSLRSGKHLLSVVNDLLDFSKMEAGRMRLSPTRFHIRTVIEEVANTVEILAREKQIAIAWPTLPVSGEVQADYVKLCQMLLNLLSNAIKFTPPSGTITCSIGGLDNAGLHARLQISVSDTGEGIPADKMGIIFESFRQVDGGHTRKHGGTGLGLAITKQLAILHGGDVLVTSELGKGSKFTIDLPRYCQRPEENEFASTDGEGKRIVIVDDDPAQLTIIARVLTEAGYKPSLVKSSAEALEVIDQIKPDLAIFDMLMPDISGLTLLRNLRQDPAYATLPVIISTAFSNHSDIVKRLGGHWLAKPWETSELIAAVRSGLAQAPAVQIAPKPRAPKAANT